MSTFKPFIKTGVWKMESATVFNFICSDSTTFKIKLLSDSTLEITPRKQDTYPYQRDTTKNERL
jgi:hypothetical protein